MFSSVSTAPLDVLIIAEHSTQGAFRLEDQFQ
jgi:hypothetical protein